MRSNYHMAGGPQCTGRPAMPSNMSMIMIANMIKMPMKIFFIRCSRSILSHSMRNAALLSFLAFTLIAIAGRV